MLGCRGPAALQRGFCFGSGSGEERRVAFRESGEVVLNALVGSGDAQDVPGRGLVLDEGGDVERFFFVTEVLDGGLSSSSSLSHTKTLARSLLPHAYTLPCVVPSLALALLPACLAGQQG